jgi:hypothetical protein
MKLPFFSRKTCSELYQSVPDNLGFYRGETFHPILHVAKTHESGIELGSHPCLVKTSPSADADNAIALYNWLKVSPVVASNDQLWTYLSHVPFVEYIRGRWSTANERTVREHYFMKGSGFTPRVSNGLSRLWWGVHLTTRPQETDPFELTRTLFSLQDVSQAFLERAYGFSVPLLHAVLKVLADPSNGWTTGQAKGDVVKAVARSLNTYGATVHYEGLPSDRLRFVIRQLLQREIGRIGQS